MHLFEIEKIFICSTYTLLKADLEKFDRPRNYPFQLSAMKCPRVSFVLLFSTPNCILPGYSNYDLVHFDYTSVLTRLNLQILVMNQDNYCRLDAQKMPCNEYSISIAIERQSTLLVMCIAFRKARVVCNANQVFVTSSRTALL
jgi:hypothetical protein